MLVSKSFSQSDQIVSSLHINHKEGEFKCFNIYFFNFQAQQEPDYSASGSRSRLPCPEATSGVATELESRHHSVTRSRLAPAEKIPQDLAPGVNGIKRSPSSLTEESKAGELAPGKPFQPNVKATFVRNLGIFIISQCLSFLGKPFHPDLMFVIKAGAYLSEAPLRWSTLGKALGLTSKH